MVAKPGRTAVAPLAEPPRLTPSGNASTGPCRRQQRLLILVLGLRKCEALGLIDPDGSPASRKARASPGEATTQLTGTASREPDEPKVCACLLARRR